MCSMGALSRHRAPTVPGSVHASSWCYTVRVRGKLACMLFENFAWASCCVGESAVWEKEGHLCGMKPAGQSNTEALKPRENNQTTAITFFKYLILSWLNLNYT